MNTSSPPQVHNFHPTYRADIDGLRALAILPVVLFHATGRWPAGGFVGVDVFFVISGYLISCIIFKSLANDDFSFAEFYAHRIKRIFPALILVLATCYGLGWFLLLPDEFKQLGKHIAAGAGYVQNFVLWQEAGYFDTTSELKPLLHLWSLAIEEQFYLVYPLLVWAAWRSGVNILVGVLVLAIVSFGLNVGSLEQDPVKTFFAPQTRFWELMAGAVLAYFRIFQNRPAWLTRWPHVNFLNGLSKWTSNEARRATAASMLSIAGFALILIAVFGFHRSQPFPGWRALLPVAGACLLIQTGPTAWVNRKILSNRFMVWIGLISYPLYLWHWPLLSFVRIVELDNPSRGIRAAAVGISFVLAWLTYRFIEKPVRFGRVTWHKTAILCVLAVLVGYAGYNAYQHGGYGFRMKDRQSFLDYFENSPPNYNFSKRLGFVEYKNACNFYDSGKPTIPLARIDPVCYQRNPAKEKTIFLWGDSHAQHLRYGLSRNLPNDWQVMVVASSGCAPNIEPADSDENLCARSNWFALQKIRETQPDVVLLAQSVGHSFEKLEAISRQLKHLGVKKVLVLGPVPHWKANLPTIVARRLWTHTPKYSSLYIYTKSTKEDVLLKAKSKATKDFRYVGLNDFFCNDDGCLVYIGDDRKTGLTSWDTGHLTPIASDYLAREYLVKFIVDRAPTESQKNTD